MPGRRSPGPSVEPHRVSQFHSSIGENRLQIGVVHHRAPWVLTMPHGGALRPSGGWVERTSARAKVACLWHSFCYLLLCEKSRPIALIPECAESEVPTIKERADLAARQGARPQP